MSKQLPSLREMTMVITYREVTNIQKSFGVLCPEKDVVSAHEASDIKDRLSSGTGSLHYGGIGSRQDAHIRICMKLSQYTNEIRLTGTAK